MIIRNVKLEGRSVDILIDGGFIIRISDTGPDVSGHKVLDGGGRVIIPGMIDPHVHLRCPGMETKEDWITGSRAALAGGVTTLIDMPNTIPATDTMHGLRIKREAAAAADSSAAGPQRLFWAGCSSENISELETLLDEPDVAGVKIFFSESSANASSSEVDFISRVFSISAEAKKPAAVHSELASLIGLRKDIGIDVKSSMLAEHNRQRPAAAAVAGTALALEIAAATGCRLYLCHLSVLPEFAMVRKYKEAYGRDSVIAELTPHHLLLNENHIVRDGQQSWAKVNPPLRSDADRVSAVEALLDGTIDCIGSDHAPHLLSEKDMSARNFHDCPSGFPGLETELCLIAGFLKKQGADWKEKLSMLTSHRAAEVFGLADRDEVAVGKRADLVILDADSSEIIKASSFETKAKYSPFNGMEMPVSIYQTIVGGTIIE